MSLIQRTPDAGDHTALLSRVEAPAVVLADRVITHAELDRLVEDRAAQLGPTRRLVLLECANALEPLVTYLAALRGRHPVLLLPALEGEAARRQWQRIVEAYQPDLICTRDGRSWVDTERCVGTRHDLHPELAVLLGTSGSTGTPKLVRLSAENLRSNAAAIAASLGLDAGSRAATTLPLQYCYGLSVVNAHLQAGGSLWLTDASVVDPGFWDAFTRAGATSIAGVPYTFELLERSGVDWLATPGLRLVTQAGGRLAPELVRDLALRSARHQVDFVVMYGQTEATARMAYLPPSLAATRSSCIGIPIDGGEIRLDEGELVYSGPNVMLGYAETPSDLALGATLTELRTGDLAVQHDDGLFEIVGRCNRIAKLYGVRLDLEHAERLLAEHGIEARLVVAHDRLHVFVRNAGEVSRVHDLVTAEHCLPDHAVRVRVLESVPLTPSGKPDLAALRALAEEAEPVEVPSDVRAAYAGVFGCAVSDDDTFRTLRGDSLSYVEVFTRLERLLGSVPPDWPDRTVAQLERAERRPRRAWAVLETPLVLRAIAIVLLVGSHVDLWTIQGGAHALLAILGFNLTRFALAAPTPRARVVAVLRSVGDAVAPAMIWFTGVILISGRFDLWSTPLMMNHVFGNDAVWNSGWRLWFLESMTWTVVPLVLLLALPGVRSAYQRWPFLVALGAFAIALLARESWSPATGPAHVYSPQASGWAIVLGVAVALADTWAKKVVVAAAAVAGTLGFFTVPLRGHLVIAAILLILVVPRLPVPRPLDRVIAVVASASLFIYITHWQVYPPLENSGHSVLALAASLALGLATWWGWGRLRSWRRAVRPDRSMPLGS